MNYEKSPNIVYLVDIIGDLKISCVTMQKGNTVSELSRESRQ